MASHPKESKRSGARARLQARETSDSEQGRYGRILPSAREVVATAVVPEGPALVYIRPVGVASLFRVKLKDRGPDGSLPTSPPASGGVLPGEDWVVQVRAPSKTNRDRSRSQAMEMASVDAAGNHAGSDHHRWRMDQVQWVV